MANQKHNKICIEKEWEPHKTVYEKRKSPRKQYPKDCYDPREPAF